MTRVFAIALLKQDIQNSKQKIIYRHNEFGIEALQFAVKALEQIGHLKDRPCEACEFYTEEGCSKWECVFEGSNAE
jgi:hypothetical protein